MNQASLLCELMKLTQFILSLSVFSYFVLHPSCLYFLHSMPNQNTFSSQLFSLATDKKYIFLLCNGILVFIAKYSTRTIDPSPPQPLSPPTDISPDSDTVFQEYTEMNLQASVEDLVQVEYVDIKEIEVEKSSEVNVSVKDEEIEEDSQLLTTDEEQIKEQVYHEIFENDNEEYVNSEYENESEYYVNEDEEQEDEEISMMNMEDLNRKFDDFIRKMKEGLRIEAQQQLIMV